MKNLFEKENKTTLIAIVAVGAAIAGLGAWLYLSESGSEKRKKLKHKLKSKAKDAVSDLVSRKTGVSKKAVKAAADYAAK